MSESFRGLHPDKTAFAKLAKDALGFCRIVNHDIQKP